MTTRIMHLAKRGTTDNKLWYYLPKDDYNRTFEDLLRLKGAYEDLKTCLEDGEAGQYPKLASVIRLIKKVGRDEKTALALMENIWEEVPYDHLENKPSCKRAKFYRLRQKLIYLYYQEEKRGN